MPRNQFETTKIVELAAARRCVSVDHLKKERDLMIRKWPDYRFMTPLSATLHFAEVYRTELRRYVHTNIDIKTAEKVQGVRKGVPKTQEGWFTQLWMARQRADELGLPYPLIVAFGFEFSSRRTRKRSPLPLQLFANERTAEAMAYEIDKYIENHLPLAINRLSDLSQYRREHYQGLPAQDLFREFLMDHIEADDTLPRCRAVARFSIVKRHIPIRDLLCSTPKEDRGRLLDNVRQELTKMTGQVQPHVALETSAFWQSCFGMSEVYDPASVPCSVCPLAASCVAVASEVDAIVKRCYGRVFPVPTAAEANRMRVEKCRAKKKALSAAGGTSLPQ